MRRYTLPLVAAVLLVLVMVALAVQPTTYAGCVPDPTGQPCAPYPNSGNYCAINLFGGLGNYFGPKSLAHADGGTIPVGGRQQLPRSGDWLVTVGELLVLVVVVGTLRARHAKR